MAQARKAATTVTSVDTYCAAYQHLFPEVRSFEVFKWLHLGLTSNISRKTLPAIAQAIGLNNYQSLLHFLTESPWQISDLRNQRLSLISQMLQGKRLTLIIDETGDKKKGKTTDYVDRQYIANLGTIENGIVSVNAYAFLDGAIFPLIFKIFKPQKRLKPGDIFKTKPQLIAEILEELQNKGFKFDLVLADSDYGECNTLINTLNQYQLNFIVGVRSNYGLWVAPSQRIKYGKWNKFNQIIVNSQQKQSYIREISFGKRREIINYWQITIDPEQLSDNLTVLLMSNLPKSLTSVMENHLGLITWLEYGCKHTKNQMGWADFRLTNGEQIERWWEIVCSAYLMRNLQVYKIQSRSEQISMEQESELIA